MGWVIFFVCSVLICFKITSAEKWRRFWYAGLISLVMIYAIDSTLIAVGAFSYRYPNPFIGQLPTLYWLSSFFGGIVLISYYPQRKLWEFPYILFSSFLFLLLELTMHYFGYFSYHHWSPIKSFFLNVFGFIVVSWLWHWISEIKVKEK